MDVLHKLLKWMDHNRGLVVALVLGALMSAWLVGCAPRTQSLLSPDQKVTQAELRREVVVLHNGLAKKAAALKAAEAELNSETEAVNESVELAEADIEAQVELRLKIIGIAGGVGTAVAEGSFSPASAIGSVISVLTLLGLGGVSYDNHRKNVKINEYKAAA